ncbi:hypothetical protein ACDX78_03975 [Virgibacillus oceani]
MEFRFTEEKNWGKKAYNGFGTALVGVFFIVFQVYLNGGSMDSLLIFIGFIPVIIGVTQGLYNMTRQEKDYVYLEEDLLTINKGLFLPRKEVKYVDINYCTVIGDFLVFKLRKDKEEQINIEYLSDEDFALLREELKKRVKIDLFRTSPTAYNTVH